MFNNPFTSTALIVLSGFLLSLLSLSMTDPYCRQVQATKLEAAGQQQVDVAIQKLRENVAAVRDAGKKISDPDALTDAQLGEAVAHLLDLPGAFTVEVARREDASESIMERMAQGQPSEAMQSGKFPYTFRIATIDSVKKDMSKHVGAERKPQIVRMVYQHNGIMISRPHSFYPDDGLRTGIATTLGPGPKTPTGLVALTFDELVPADLLNSDTVKTTVTDIGLANKTIRSHADFEVLTANDRSYQAEAKVAGRVFLFDVQEQPGANLRPNWIKWGAFLLCNAFTCIIGLSWQQRMRASLLQRNDELESEVTRRIALEKHLQATIDFRDHERELIAHEIHDGFVQDVIGAQMFAEAATAQTEPTSTLQKHTSAIAELLGNAIEEARKTIDYLKPRVVDEVGLVAALQHSVDHDLKNYSFHMELRCDDDLPRFPILVERMLYRIIREAVSNARQHSGCDRAIVGLSADAERIVVEVTDQGVGFNESDVRSDSFGLPGIRQRIEMLNGQLTLHSSEFGTKIVVEIPADLVPPDMPPNESLMLKI